MPTLLPGLLMLTESVVFLVLEWRLRRRTHWRQGALDHTSAGVVGGPVVVFLTGALVFSTGGWDLLRLPGVLTVVALPVALGAGARAVRAHRWRLAEEQADRTGGPAGTGRRWQPTALAVALSVLGLGVLATGAPA